MTQELLSTSAPAGLHPGSSGFCTVMQSRDLPQPTAELLETLSGYRPVFLPGDPREAENPPALSHVRLTSRGRTVSVLSRVAATDRDYTNRSNRVAHHVVLDATDTRPVGGPGWLATVPGFLERVWDGQVRWLPTGRAVPHGDAPGGGATWQRLTGDPGWAAALADAMLKGKPFYLVYDLGMDVGGLIAEALSRVPAERRWDVTFTTYYTGLPSGVRCDIRAVLRGTAEERAAPASARLDVAALRGRTPPPVEVPAAPPPMRTPSRVAAVAAAAVAPVAEQAVAPVAEQEETPRVLVEEQLREEFGLKPAKSLKKGGGAGLALLVTMSLVVVAASGIGGWLLFNEGKKPDDHAGTKDGGDKVPPKDAVAAKDGGKKEGGKKDVTEKPVPPVPGKKAIKLALKPRQDRIQVGDDVEFLLEIKGEGDIPIDREVFKKVYISPKGTKAADRTPAVADEKDGVVVWQRYKAKKAGKEEFVAEYDGGEKYDKAQASATIEIEKRLVRLELNFPKKDVFVGQAVKATASTSNEDFDAWDAVRINEEKGRSLVISPKKPGSITVTLEKGETDVWRWEEVKKTLVVKAKDQPVLTLSKPNPNYVLRGVLEFMVEVKLGGKPFNQGKVQVYDGERPLLPKPEQLGKNGTASINILRDAKIAPGEKKRFTVKLTPDGTVADKVDPAEAATDEYRVAASEVKFFDVKLKVVPVGAKGKTFEVRVEDVPAIKDGIPTPRITEFKLPPAIGTWKQKERPGSYFLILGMKDVVLVYSGRELTCRPLSIEINKILKSDKEGAEKVLNKDWAEKVLKPALEASEIWLFSAKSDKGKVVKESEEPALVVKFRVTVTPPPTVSED